MQEALNQSTIQPTNNQSTNPPPNQPMQEALNHGGSKGCAVVWQNVIVILQIVIIML